MKRVIKIKFVDFWIDFNNYSNFITLALSEHYILEFSDQPDYLFYSVFGYQHTSYKCIKIFFTGENIVPDFNVCDYALGFDHMTFGDRYLRLPLYQLYDSYTKLESAKVLDFDKLLKRKFCCIVVSNIAHASPHRERFFKLLSEYKQVDSGGRMWNNVGGPVKNKLEFVSNYKFNIAFENSSVLGYTTEKIMEPMAVNTLPIYWGNRLVDQDFNPSSFINVNDFSSMEDAVQRIVDIDNDDSKYINIMSEPWILDREMLSWRSRLTDFLIKIIEKPLADAKYLSDFGYQHIYRSSLYSTCSLYKDRQPDESGLLKRVYRKLNAILR